MYSAYLFVLVSENDIILIYYVITITSQLLRNTITLKLLRNIFINSYFENV